MGLLARNLIWSVLAWYLMAFGGTGLSMAATTARTHPGGYTYDALAVYRDGAVTTTSLPRGNGENGLSDHDLLYDALPHLSKCGVDACAWPGLRAAAKGGGKAFSKEKGALVDMAKGDKRTGMTSGDMQAYKDLNKGLPDPFPANKVRGPEVHPPRTPNSPPGPGQQPHGHVGPVNHIPINGG